MKREPKLSKFSFKFCSLYKNAFLSIALKFWIAGFPKAQQILADLYESIDYLERGDKFSKRQRKRDSQRRGVQIKFGQLL